MKNLTLRPRTFAFVVATRAALAAGIGLLFSGRLSEARRRAVGKTLVAIGVVTTIPAAVSVMRGMRRSGRNQTALAPGVAQDEHLVGSRRFPRKGDDEIMRQAI